MGDGNETRRFGRTALAIGAAAALALAVGGCCLDDGSDCDSDSDCCSDYCDEYGTCVSAAKGASRAVRDPARAMAEKTPRPQARFSLECLKKQVAR